MLNKTANQVVFYTYPKFIFCWPIIVLGYVLYGLHRGQAVCPESHTWFWLICLILVLVTLGFDLGRNYTVFWVVLLGGCWILILWLRDVKHITIFSKLYTFFTDLNPSLAPSFVLLVSLFLSLFWIIMWFWTRINSKWRITHNEFEHYQFGRMDDSLARGAKSVRTSYPDLFELLVCLAGDLMIFDSSGRKLLLRIPHVPLLPLVKTRINRILESTAVTAVAEEEFSDSGEVSDDGSGDR